MTIANCRNAFNIFGTISLVLKYTLNKHYDYRPAVLVL
jgi:hypothetical protein